MRSAALNWSYLRSLLRRALLLWLPLRALVSFTAVYLRLDPCLAAPGKVLVVLVVATVCAVDSRATRDVIFFANLGTPSWAPALAGALVAAVLEVAIAMVCGVVLR
jgi:hypothetical protein